MTELSHTLQELPLISLIPIGLLVIVGLLLWAAGRRVLRAGFAAVGLLIGGSVGWLLGSAFNLGVPAWLVAVIGALGLACVAALLYRFAVAAALAWVLAIAMPLLVVVVTELNPNLMLRAEAGETTVTDSGPAQSPPGEREPDEIDRWINPERWLKEQMKEHMPRHPAMDGLDGQPLSPREIGERLGAGEELGEQIDRLESYARQLVDAIGSAWEQTNPALRPYLIASAIAGGLLGMLIGALAPGFSAALVTAFGGSMLWLGGTRVIVESLGYTEASWMPGRGTTWLTIWVVVSIVGFAIQWTFLRRKADKAG